MLFILYGATLEMGYQSRELFKDLGFDIIQKYNYVTNDSKLNKSMYENANPDKDFARWYNDKIYVSSFEEIEQCDFRYGLDGETPFRQQDVAARLGISRSYVSRIEKKALEKLRRALEN